MLASKRMLLGLLGGARLPPFVPTSAQSTAFLARTSGLNNTYKAAYDALITGLVTDGVWSKFDGLYLLGSQSQANALLNLVSSSYALTLSGTTTFTASYGIQGNGTNGVINTNFNPSTAGGNFTQDSAHMGAWTQNERAFSTGAVLSIAGTPNTNIYPYYSDGKTYFRLNDATSAAGFVNGSSRGHHVAVRSSSTARAAYRDGNSLGAIASNTSGALSNNPIRALVSGDSLAYTTDEIGAIHFGSSLTAGEVATVYSRIATFYNTLWVTNPSTYLFAGFVRRTGALNAGQRLSLMQSGDGITFYPRTSTYVPANGVYVRDPAIAYHSAHGRIYLAHTNVTFGIATTSFDIGYSTNGHDFISLGAVDCSGVVSGANATVYAPEFAKNTDGTIWLDGSGKPAIYFAASNTGLSDTGQQLYVVQPNSASDYTLGWGVPVIVTGTGIPTNIIDADPYISGSTLTLWFKDETTRYVGYMTGSTASLSSGFVVSKSGNWAGWGQPFEGQTQIYQSGNTREILLDPQGSAPGYQYSITTDAGATWSAPVVITAPRNLPQHGTIIPMPAGMAP